MISPRFASGLRSWRSFLSFLETPDQLRILTSILDGSLLELLLLEGAQVILRPRIPHFIMLQGGGEAVSHRLERTEGV